MRRREFLVFFRVSAWPLAARATADIHRMPAMAADLVGRQVAVIAAIGDPSPFVAKAATETRSRPSCCRRGD
jgi:hypothetical protein